MSLVLGSNISALRAQRQLSKTGQALESTFERLSSGLRINRASDDAAGLSISESLRADSRVLTQAVRNINDGISLLNIANSALNEAGAILQRLEELSIQSANGTYSSAQRNALDIEAQALSEEYSRILNSTTYNGKSLFSPSASGTTLQIGLDSSDSLNVEFRETENTLTGTGTYTTQNLNIVASDPNIISARALVGDFNNDGIDDIVFAQIGYSGSSNPELDAGFVLGTSTGTYSLNDTVNSVTSTSGSTGTLYLGLTDQQSDGDTDVLFSFDGTSDFYAYGINDGTGNFSVTGFSGGLILTSGGTTTVNGDFNGDGVADTAQIIASGTNLTLRVSTQNTTSTVAFREPALDDFSLATTSSALLAKDVFTSERDVVQSMQGKIGASLSRLQVAESLNTKNVTEFEAARGRIIDADMAEESAALVRLNILQQAATAVLAQANQQPSLALRLLSNDP